MKGSSIMARFLWQALEILFYVAQVAWRISFEYLRGGGGESQGLRFSLYLTFQFRLFFSSECYFYVSSYFFK